MSNADKKNYGTYWAAEAVANVVKGLDGLRGSDVVVWHGGDAAGAVEEIMRHPRQLVMIMPQGNEYENSVQGGYVTKVQVTRKYTLLVCAGISRGLGGNVKEGADLVDAVMVELTGNRLGSDPGKGFVVLPRSCEPVDLEGERGSWVAWRIELGIRGAVI